MNNSMTGWRGACCRCSTRRTGWLSPGGVLAAAYPAVWGLGQIGTGALSDRIGGRADRRRDAAQALAIGLIAAASTFAVWLFAAALSGSSRMVYPTLLAAVADVATPRGAGRRSAFTGCGGMGFAVGAIVAGVF